MRCKRLARKCVHTIICFVRWAEENPGKNVFSQAPSDLIYMIYNSKTVYLALVQSIIDYGILWLLRVTTAPRADSGHENNSCQ